MKSLIKCLLFVFLLSCFSTQFVYAQENEFNENKTEEWYVDVAEKIFYNDASLYVEGVEYTNKFVEDFKELYENGNTLDMLNFLNQKQFMILYQGDQSIQEGIESRAITRTFYNSMIAEWSERPSDNNWKAKIEYRLTVNATMNDVGAFIINGNPTLYSYYISSNFNANNPNFSFYFRSGYTVGKNSSSQAYAQFIPHVMWPDGYSLQVTCEAKLLTNAGASSQPSPIILRQITNW